jgi:hypothetical protein
MAHPLVKFKSFYNEYESRETDPRSSAAGIFRAVACRKYNITHNRLLHPQTRAGSGSARFGKDVSGITLFTIS